MWCVAAIALGTWLLLTTIWVDRSTELHEATTWPVSSATVNSHNVVEVRGSKGSRSYRPELQYTYLAPDGGVRFGARIHGTREPSRSRDWARRRLSKFPIGGTVPVYVNPADSSVSLLEPGMREGDWREGCWVGAGLLMVISLTANAWHLARRRGAGYVAGVRIIDGPPLRCRKETSGSLAGGFYLGTCVAAAVAVVAYAADEGSMVWLIGGFALGLGVAVVTWLSVNSRRDKPKPADLVMDYDAELVITPTLFESASMAVAMPTVIGTSIMEVTRGSGKSRTTVHQVHLMLNADGSRGPIALAFGSAAIAGEFETWLKQQLALEGA